MEFEVREYTTSYKYFYNNDICFVASAKLGSRFLRNFIQTLKCEKYNYPFSRSMHLCEMNDGVIPGDKESYQNYLINNILTATKDVVFLIRNPDLRFISGVSTLLTICEHRFFGANESGKEFMKSFFHSDISEDEYEIGIETFKFNLRNFIDTQNGEYLRNIIFDNIVPHSLIKDAHVEYHHYMAYGYMNTLVERGIIPKWLELESLDRYILSKQIEETEYYNNKKVSQNSTSNTIYYSFAKLFLDTWKKQNKQLDFHIKTEWEYYSKIKADYEVLL